MTVPLPPQGDTTWYPWVTQVHAKTTTELDAKTNVTVDGSHVDTFAVDSTPITPADIGAAAAADITALNARLNTTPGSTSSLWSAGATETLPRVGNREITGTSGRLSLTYAVAPTTVTINTLAVQVNGTASAGATVARMALFTVAGNGDLTKVAQTANDVTTATATYDKSEKALSTTGGFPGSYTLVAGQRYAFGWLNVATTPASLNGQFADFAYLPPFINKHINGQTDIAATYTDASLTGFYQPLLIVGILY